MDYFSYTLFIKGIASVLVKVLVFIRARQFQIAGINYLRWYFTRGYHHPFIRTVIRLKLLNTTNLVALVKEVINFHLSLSLATRLLSLFLGRLSTHYHFNLLRLLILMGLFLQFITQIK